MRIIFWGCPSLCSGRAVSGLAGLLGPSPASLARSGLRPPFPIPQPAAMPLLDAEKPIVDEDKHWFVLADE